MEGRRSSATVLIGVTLLVAIVSAIPVDIETASCSNNAVLGSLSDNAPDADEFCRDFAPEAVPVETNSITFTTTEGHLTAFHTVQATPTFTLTVMVDNIVTVTPPCNQPSTAAAPTPTAGLAENPAAAIVMKQPSTPALPVGAQPKIAGPKHGRRDTELPDYVAGYEDTDISAGCNCFMADKTSTLTYIAETVTQTIDAIMDRHCNMDLVR